MQKKKKPRKYDPFSDRGKKKEEKLSLREQRHWTCQKKAFSILNMLKKLKETIDKEPKETRRPMSPQKTRETEEKKGLKQKFWS